MAQRIRHNVESNRPGNRIAGSRRMLWSMFELFSDGARRVIVHAQDEARALNHSHIGTEHLLLGVLAEDNGVGARVLEALGISLDDSRRKVVEIVGRGGSVPSGPAPFTPRAKTALTLSLRESMRLDSSYIGTGHVLLGLIAEGEGIAAQVLVTLGVDLRSARGAVVELYLATGSAESAVPPGNDNRLRAEIARLRALLRRHGIDPDG